MAIINPGDNVIMENVVDGTELARRIERFMAAFHSQNSNPTRPPSLTSGGIWTRTGSPGDPMPMLFDGTTDVPLRPMTWKASFALSADTVLDGQHANSRIGINVPNLNITLPTLASCPLGATILITGQAAFISAAPGDTISASGVGSTVAGAFVKPDVDNVMFVRGGTSWSADLGGAVLPYSANFARSHAVNGYQKFPGGLILQWGNAAIAAGSSLVTFPISFNATPFFVGGNYGSNAAIIATTRAWTATGFTAELYTDAGVSTATSGLPWTAIGR